MQSKSSKDKQRERGGVVVERQTLQIERSWSPQLAPCCRAVIDIDDIDVSMEMSSDSDIDIDK